MEPLKEMFNSGWFEELAGRLSEADKGINRKKFVSDCCRSIEDLALNQRLRRTSLVMKEHLPSSYPKALKILKEVAPQMRPGYTNLVFPDFVGLYGHHHFDLSMDALSYFTRYGSSEFAIREFLKNDFDKTIQVMYDWAGSSNQHVRRLASEGSRPRLPWSFKLDRVISKPAVTKPILQTLRADPELYVRKSVANHLNDISKIDPSYLLKLFASWKPAGERTLWIIRHASRTLIKKGHQESLAALDFEKDPRFGIKAFKLSASSFRIGDKMEFGFEIQSRKNKSQKLAIDYRIHYQKKNGISAKTFKLREIDLPPLGSLVVKKNHGLADLSTRTHHPGRHLFELQVNGRVVLKEAFVLKS